MLEQYEQDVQRLRNLGNDWSLTDNEIDHIIEESFHFLECEKAGGRLRTEEKTAVSSLHFPGMLWKIAVCTALLGFIIYTLMTYRKATLNYIERNVQEIIYPGMKMFRKLMLPVIRVFPSLTEWYDETCLVGNPYFRVSDMDCWPCENTRSVLNVTGSNMNSEQYHSGIPFIYKEANIRTVKLSDLQRTYVQQKAMFDRDAWRVEATPRYWQNVDDMMLAILDSRQTAGKDAHVTWRLNRLEPARAVRHLFGSPRHTPHYTVGATPEKFILVDEPHSPRYALPTTEGSTVFVVQGSGARVVVLDPAPECRSTCHRVSIVLQPQHVLWYNWWYWRGSSFPLATSKATSITYIGSYY